MTDVNALLKQHEGLIRFMAQPFFGQGVPAEDLLQEARLAFVECIANWSEEHGAAIWTYARPRVFGAMVDYMTRQASEASTPNQTGEEVFDWEEQEYAPSPEDLFLEKERRMEIRKAVGTLTPSDAELLAMWMTSSSYDELGDRLGVSKTTAYMRAQQLIERIREAARRAA